MNSNITYKLHTTKETELRKDLENLGFSIDSAEYAFWRASKKGITVTFYKNGKLLIQGSKMSDIVNYLIEKGFIEAESTVPYSKWIGTDEAGKGDYFGYLVIAGVLIKDNITNNLLKLGIQDSKNLSDTSIQDLAKKIKKLCIYSIVSISPQKYNELLSKMKNLNRLLAWGHARVIENILNKEDCQYAISDQFGDEKYILEALMKKGKKLKLEQKPHAESDIGVASASILARDEFIKRLDELSRKYNILFPKGVSNEVIKTGKEFIQKYGKDKLSDVAKIHFKTTNEIIKP